MENNIFESKSIPKAYFTLAVPVVLGMVISIVYNITDTYYISLTKNTNLVAGVSLCAPVFTLLMGFGNIFGQGGSSLISRLLGQKDKDNLRRVSSFCFYAAIVFGLVSGALMLLLRIPILHLLGADAETITYALPYYTFFAAGAPFVTLSFIHINLLRSEGMAKESMIATVSGSVINIILDPILIFKLNMGAAGAALATIVGYVLTDSYCLFVVLKKSKVLFVDARNWKISRDHARQIFSIGFSAALSNITSSVCMILTNQQLLKYGNDKIAAMGIVQKVSMIIMLVIVGFSFGGAPLIGYTYGAKNKERMKALLGFVVKFLCTTAFVMSVVMVVLAPYVMRVFMEDPALVSTGVLMLRTQVMGMTLMAVVLFFTIFFQATGKALPSLVLALSRQGVVFVIVLFAAVAIGGYYGVILTQFIADIISAAIAFVLYRNLR